MATVCSCDTGFKNTGTPSCLFVPGITSGLILVPRFGSDGTRNKILKADALTADYVRDKIHAADGRNRWYPISGKFQRVADTRAEPTTEDFDSNALIVRDGIRTWTGDSTDAPSPVYAAKLRQVGCVALDVYLVDESGNLHGEYSNDGNLYGYAVQTKSFNAVAVPATATTLPVLRVSFTFDNDIDDSKIGYVSTSDIDADLKSIRGLIDVYVVAVGTPSTTGLVVDMFYDYGSKDTKRPYRGAGVDKLILTNLTVGDAVTVDTITESTVLDGRYTFDFTGDAQTAGDILRVESKVTSNVLDSTGHEVVKSPLTAIGS